MRKILALALIALASPVAAQEVSTSAPDYGAVIADMQAQIPVPANTVPSVETPGGAAGTAMTFRRGDAVENRISRTGVFSYNASGQVLCGGSATCSWDVPLPAGSASYPVFFTAIAAAARRQSAARSPAARTPGLAG